MIVLAAFDMGAAAMLLMVVLLLMIIVLFWVSRDEESDRTDGE